METRTAFLPAGIDVSRCKFVVGDACNMFDIKLPGGQALGEFVCKNFCCFGVHYRALSGYTFTCFVPLGVEVVHDNGSK